MKIKVLIVDDHPAMIEGYKSILSLNSSNWQFEITVAFNARSAYDIVMKASADTFDIILLDVILPPVPALKIQSGEDIAKLILDRLPGTRLAMLTSHTEAFVLYAIVKDIRPNGLLVKCDFSPEEFLDAFERIMRGEIYHSVTVRQGIKDMLKKDKYLDTYNRQIISLLGQGIKTKNLPAHINLSISAIDKRKVQIKDYFEIEKGDDEDIIREAKKNGFI